jgi:Txe/YoeB family toxin of Txe-Axe toxin-antitoxin module
MKEIHNETKGSFMILKERIVKSNKRSAEMILKLSRCGENIGQVKEGVKVVIDITEEIRNESKENVMINQQISKTVEMIQNENVKMVTNQEKLSGKVSDVQCFLNNLYDEISKKYLETTEKIKEQKSVMTDTVESLNTYVEEMNVRINDQMEMISERIKMVWQENSNQLANAEAKMEYIITEVQNMTEKNNSNKGETNQQLNEVLQMLQEFENGSMKIIEQVKSLFVNIHGDLSNRIDSIKG